MKVLGGIVLVFMLVVAFNPLMDEVTAIGTHEEATRFDQILYSTFPPLYSVMILCSVGASVYWMWKR